MSERTVLLYFQDIKDGIERIEKYIKGVSFDQFKNDAKTIDAVVRNIETIGEAARQLPEELRVQHPTVPWKLMVGARNKVIHQYFGVDIEVVWKTASEDLSELKKQIEVLIQDMK